MQVVYAVIRTGGKQYRVKVGDVIDVEKLPADDGADLRFEPLLVVDDDGVVRSLAADLAGASVSATVVDTHRGKKIRVFTYKNKTGQKRTQGHRQSLTRLLVDGIELPGGKKAKPEAKPEAKAKPETKADDKAEAKAEAKPARARAAKAEVSEAAEPKAKPAKATAAKEPKAAKPKADSKPKAEAEPAGTVDSEE
jgi:large subunit ribosomal protein L21